MKKTLKGKEERKNLKIKYTKVANIIQDYRINFKYDNLITPAKPIEIIPFEEKKEILEVNSIIYYFFLIY